MDVNKTAARTLAILETFARTRRPLTLAELARLIRSPSTSCLYIVRTLEAAGYLYRTSLHNRLYPTRKLLGLATVISESEPWLEELIPLLEALRDDTRETVILGKLQGSKVIYLATFDGTETMRFNTRAGDVRSIHSTAVGKALFAALPEARQKTLLKKMEFVPLTQNTLTDAEAFCADAAQTVARGYSISREESAQGVTAIAQAVVVLTESYAISVVGLTERVSPTLDKYALRLAATCKAMTELQIQSEW